MLTFLENSVMTGVVPVTQRNLTEVVIHGFQECTGTEARLTLERGGQTQPVTDAKLEQLRNGGKE